MANYIKVKSLLIFLLTGTFIFGESNITPISPGKTLTPGEILKTETPILRWNSQVIADYYIVCISYKDKNNCYYPILFHKIYGASNKNAYKVPSGLLKYGFKYKWELRACIDGYLKDYSESLYFHIEKKADKDSLKKKSSGNATSSEGNNSSNNPSPEQLLSAIHQSNSSDTLNQVYLLLNYDDIVRANISAFYENNTFYLPLTSILNLVEIYSKTDRENKIVKGFFPIPASTYIFDFSKLYFRNKAGSFKLKKEDFIQSKLDYYIKPYIFQKAFKIIPQIDFNNLSVKLISKKELPVKKRLDRESKYNFLKKQNRSINAGFIVKRNRQLLDGGILDYRLASNYTRGQSPYYAYETGLGTEFFGGDLEVITEGNILKNNFSNSETSYIWHYSVNKKYIKQISFGTLYTGDLRTMQIRGIQINNEPIEPLKTFSGYTFSNRIAPNWTIEMYINGRLTDITKSDAVGNYHFNIPLDYGSNLVQFKYYGPSGEFYTENKQFQIPLTFLSAGEFRYNAAAGEVYMTNHFTGNAKASIGISNWLTEQAGIEYYNDPLNNKPIIYNSLSFRVAPGYFFNILTAPDAYYQLSASVINYSQMSADLEYTRYSKNLFYNPSKIKDNISVGFFAPFKIDKLPFSVNLNMKMQNSQIYTIRQYSLGADGTFGFITPSLNYILSASKSADISVIKSNISGGFLMPVSKLKGFFSILNGGLINSSLEYNITDRRFSNFDIAFSFEVYSGSRFQISHINNFKYGYSSTQLEFKLNLNSTTSWFTVSPNYVTQSIQGSLLLDSHYDKLEFYNRQQIGRSGVAFRLFLDKNGNGKYDKGEELIKDASLTINSSGSTERNDNGVIRFGELDPYTKYTVEINAASIKNPMWIPLYKTFSFISSPNSSKPIDIPFYTAGELSGSVSIESKKTVQRMAGINIIIKNLLDHSKISVPTFADGTFYYFGLKPGKYDVYIDPKQLNMLESISSPKDKIINVPFYSQDYFSEDINFKIISDK